MFGLPASETSAICFPCLYWLSTHWQSFFSSCWEHFLSGVEILKFVNRRFVFSGVSERIISAFFRVSINRKVQSFRLPMGVQQV